MTADPIQIRLCTNCGLRYPLVNTGPIRARCPVCLGVTKLVREILPNQEVRGKELPAQTNQPRLRGLLDNLRSGLNVGSIFRTSEGLGFNHLHLCGITPTPENGDVSKTALGAEKYIAWSYHRNAVEEVLRLKTQEVKIIALENSLESQPVDTLDDLIDYPSPEMLVVVGNEIAGIDPGILELADHCIYIQMHGEKSSFNVAVAFAIAAYSVVSMIKSRS